MHPRQQEILEALQAGRPVTVTQLVARFHVTPATIRRDLVTMPARTARHGRGNLVLHLPESHHREQSWQNLWTEACGPPPIAA